MGHSSCHMKWSILLSVTILSLSAHAQDSTICACHNTVRLKYSKKAEENRISGKVLIEVDVDSFCLFSNPVIKKGLGYGCDEEALKQVRGLIEGYNACRRKCQLRSRCTAGKFIQTVTFQLP